MPMPDSVKALLDPKSEPAEGAQVPLAASQWMSVLDLAVTPHLLRTYILETPTADSALRSLIRFLVSKPKHSQEDRDKVDWLATHLFKLREESKHRPAVWPKADVMEILEGIAFPPLSKLSEDLLMELPALLDEVKYFRTFSQITDSHIIQRVRDLKNQFGDDFFHPDMLTAIVNYNLFFGKQFQGLMQDAVRQVHEFAKSEPNTPAPDEKLLLSTDYRLTGDALRQLGNLGRTETPQQATEGNLASQQATPEQQLKQLGVDATQENLYLRNRTEELLMRVRSNPSMTSVPNSFAPLMLDEWETSAMRNPYPDSEQSFRADFARGITRALAIMYRIYEEIPQFLEKKGTEYLWKRHYDSLVYLLYEGRNQKEMLLQLSSSSGGRGLKDKAKQLELTAQKLDIGLSKVAELF